MEELCNKLRKILGSNEVYYQPPEGYRMNYPAIRVELNKIGGTHANNKRYINRTSYKLTFMSYNPESKTVKDLMNLPYCSYLTSYAKNGLYHWVFNIY